MNRTLLIAAFLAILAGGVSGQTAPEPRGGSCFRGRPLPTCRTFWITEASYAALVTPADGQGESGPDDRYVATLELGRMRNLSDRFAIGIGLGAGTFDGLHFAVKPRARYWMSQNVAFDLSPGVRLTGRQGGAAVTGDASIIYQDKVGVFAHAIAVPFTRFSQETQTTTLHQRLSVLLGLRLGSKFGVAGAVGDAVAAVVIGGAILIVCGSGACS